jgi:hypothetical protein
MSNSHSTIKAEWKHIPLSLAGTGALLQGVAVVLLIATAIAGYLTPEMREQPGGRKIPKMMVDQQAASGSITRCELLNSIWSHQRANEGSGAAGPNARAELAIATCERGDSAGGSIELEQLLRQYGILVPSPSAVVSR